MNDFQTRLQTARQAARDDAYNGADLSLAELAALSQDRYDRVVTLRAFCDEHIATATTPFSLAARITECDYLMALETRTTDLGSCADYLRVVKSHMDML